MKRNTSEMPLKKTIAEFRELGAQIQAAHEKNYKRNKKDKTASYKRKRIQEATTLYDKFCKKVTEREAQLKEPDDCFVGEKTEYQRIYKLLVDSLMAIPSDEEEQNQSDTEDSTTTTAVRTQTVRFETIRRNLSDIESKMATDTGIRNSENIKIKRIMEPCGNGRRKDESD